MDVIIRVRAVRPYGVKAMLELLVDAEMQAQCSRDATAAQVSLPACACLFACAAAYFSARHVLLCVLCCIGSLE